MKKLLFSPGPVPQTWELNIDYSHRSLGFSNLYLHTRDLLSEMVPNKNILFIQGSGSAAIESVMASLSADNCGIWSNGIFSKRAKQVASIYKDIYSLEEDLDKVDSYLDMVYAVQFETSESKYIELRNLSNKCKQLGIILVVDIVSAFPHYELPDADILIMSSAKQFRGLPVMGIVAYDKEIKFNAGVAEYLSLASYEKYAEKGQTPHTSLWPQFETLRVSLEFGLWIPGVKGISTNAGILKSAIGDRLIGDKIAPVLTIKSNNVIAVSEYLEEKNIEVYMNASYMADKFQVSCFNYGTTEPYERLAEELKRLDKEGKL